MGILAYVGSMQYRSLFRPQYEAVVSAHKLPFKLWKAVRASGMLFSDSLWIWRNPQKALQLVEVQNWDVVEAAINEGYRYFALQNMNPANHRLQNHLPP